ncbi:hypothetical protein JXB37_08695, partial [candidate division WOR-3 bacterium]|nr:hypothetical protein [candidate division WOR-3 bacterium]
DALARYALGRLFNELPGMLGGSRSRAEDELRAALEADPRLTIARLELARVLAATGRLPEARCQLDTLLAETEPGHPAEYFRHDRPAALELRARLESR